MRSDYLKQIVFPVLIWLISSQAGRSQDTLSPEQLGADFAIFEKALKEAHPGLYRYNTPAHFDSILAQTALKLDHPMTRQEFYRTLLPVAVQVKCGHTKFHPDENWSDNYYFGTQRVFPLKLYIHGDKAWIQDSYNSGTRVIKGAEVLSINNLSMSEIISRLSKGFFSDGSNTTFKYIEMSHYFSASYANLIDAPQSFEIKYSIGKDITSMNVPSIPRSIIDQYEKTHSGNNSPGAPYSFGILGKNTGLLTISSFWMGKDGEFKRFLKKAFSTINKSGIDNLIIDVRNNEGGNDKRGALLLSWLMSEEFRYYDRLEATTKSKYTFAQYAHLPKFYGILRHLIKKTDSGTYVWNHSAGLKVQKPKKNSYSGKVYILINGGSFSVTSEFAAVAHYLKRAEFIGEETGGGYYGDNSGTFVIVTLPNSRMNVGIPMLAYYTAVRNFPFTDRGVIPDHEVVPAINDILNKKDNVLSFTMELIEKHK
jgi:hypothetical protein